MLFWHCHKLYFLRCALVLLVAFISSVSFSSVVVSQDDPSKEIIVEKSAGSDSLNGDSVVARTKEKAAPFFHKPPMATAIKSLFFTHWHYQAIKDAKNSQGVVRLPSDWELNKENTDDVIDPGPRDVSLGGILYKSDDNWTIWLNGQRITPDAVPPEVLDLRVFDSHIEIKWHDDYTDKIFPIRMRAHERFNLDTRTFLPG